MKQKRREEYLNEYSAIMEQYKNGDPDADKHFSILITRLESELEAEGRTDDDIVPLLDTVRKALKEKDIILAIEAYKGITAWQLLGHAYSEERARYELDMQMCRMAQRIQKFEASYETKYEFPRDMLLVCGNFMEDGDGED